jgi:toxin CptA
LTIHNAPPVVYPLGRSHFLRRLLLGLWLAGLLLTMLWLYVGQRLDWRVASAFAAVLGAGAAVRAGWNNMPTGQLVWDGKAWRWESASYQTGIAEHELSIIADFQSRLLLRLENPASASLWLWMERSAFPERWLDLRRAVYSVRKAPAALPSHDLQPAAAAVSDAMPLVDIPRIKS